MIISLPKITTNGNEASYSFDITRNNKTNNIWIKVDKKYTSFVSDFSDAALLAMLLPAMVDKDSITVYGKISKHLYDNLNQIQELLCKIIPWLHKIKIEAETVVDQTKIKKEITFAGFSAGVDAFVTLEDYFLKPKSDTKITHLLFNNLIYNDNISNDKFNHIKKLVDQLNLPLIYTRTNLHKIYEKKKIGFEQTHPIRNAVIAHALSNHGVNFLYSSSFPKSEMKIKPWPDLAIANPILLPLISTPNVEVIDVGSEYTRIQKTYRVSKIEYSYDFLDICIGKKHLKSDFYNCSQCYKCMRALVTFEKIGVLEKYNKLFDLNLYYQNKEDYLIKVKNSKQLNDVDLVRFLNGEINVNPE